MIPKTLEQRLLVERDEARAIARRMAAALRQWNRRMAHRELTAFDALPWAKGQ